MKEGDRSLLIQQIDILENKLKEGTFVVKAGHKMKDASNGSETIVIPLTCGQIQQRRREIDNLQRVLYRGLSKRKYYPKVK